MPTDPSLSALDAIEPEQPQDTPTEVEEQAPVEDTPETPTPVIDHERRYNDLRSEFDRRNAERKAELEELEALRAAAAQPQYPAPQPQYVDDDDDDVYVADPLQDPRLVAHLQRLDAIEAQLTQQREQETLRQRSEDERAYLDNALDYIEEKFNENLSDMESAWIGKYALEHRDEHGRPDVELAYATYAEMLESRKQKWVSSKPGAGSAPVSGPGAVEVPDLDDPEARAAFLDTAFE